MSNSDEWITRTGKLGGKGFLEKSISQQHKILNKCVKNYGYRSCLGSIMVLSRNRKIKQSHGKELKSLQDYLRNSFGGEGSFSTRKSRKVRKSRKSTRKSRKVRKSRKSTRKSRKVRKSTRKSISKSTRKSISKSVRKSRKVRKSIRKSTRKSTRKSIRKSIRRSRKSRK